MRRLPLENCGHRTHYVMADAACQDRQPRTWITSQMTPSMSTAKRVLQCRKLPDSAVVLHPRLPNGWDTTTDSLSRLALTICTRQMGTRPPPVFYPLKGVGFFSLFHSFPPLLLFNIHLQKLSIPHTSLNKNLPPILLFLSN